MTDRIITAARLFDSLKFHNAFSATFPTTVTTELVKGLRLPDKDPNDSLFTWYTNELDEIITRLAEKGITLNDPTTRTLQEIKRTTEEVAHYTEEIIAHGPREDVLHSALQCLRSAANLLKRGTDPLLNPPKALAEEALESAAFRGHTMSPIRPRGARHWYSICLVCGKTLLLTPNPAPNEINASGSALALHCGRPNDDLRTAIRRLETQAAQADPGLASTLQARAARLRGLLHFEERIGE